MKKVVLALLLIANALIIWAQNESELQKAQNYLNKRNEVRFKFNLPNILAYQNVKNLISIDNVDGLSIEAYANKKEFEKFIELGYDYQVMPAAGETAKDIVMATTIAEMASWDRYPTFEVYQQMMLNFAIDYPDICSIDTMGFSEEGRAVLVAKISDNLDTDELEPEFYYTGQMHGDEIVTYILFLRMIDYLLENYNVDTRVTALVNNYEIWINPLSNPDGTYAGGNSTVNDATRSNSNGVDLNRNFPSPTLLNPSGQNQAEIQMQIAFAEAHNFVMSANSHSGAEVVNYPWDTWTSNVKTHPDNNWWDFVSHNYANTVHNNSTGYLTGFDNGVTHGGDWYTIDGGRQDHMNYFQHCREVTLELSNNKMLSSSLLPAHWTYNRDAMLGYIEECMFGFHGTVKNNGGAPLDASIIISSHDEDNSEVYTDPITGNYYRPIEPGAYDVTFSSYGYISETHSITITNYTNSITLDVILDNAATINISGTVYDGTNSLPIEGVTIEIVGTPVGTQTTNSSGQYAFNGILENLYTFKLTHPDYATVIEEHTVSQSNNVIDFIMLPSQAISFEDGQIPNDFTNSATYPWTIDNTNAYHGTYCLKSGAIGHDQVSEISLSYDVLNAGEISFFKKVSSEEDYDELNFYIDSDLQNAWSGNIAWSEESYPVSTGTHNFKWTYTKDGSQIGGSDCAWIDYIILPPSSTPQPILSVNKDTLLGSTFEGFVDIDTLLLTNIGEGVLNYTIDIENAGSHPWLGLQTNSGSLNASETDEIAVEMSGIAVGIGNYSTNIIITTSKSQKTIPVIFQVKPENIDNIDNNLFSIYPSPCIDKINIKGQFGNSNEIKLFVYSIDGKLLIEKEIENTVINTIDLSILSEGLYFYKIKSNNENLTGKLLKQ